MPSDARNKEIALGASRLAVRDCRWTLWYARFWGGSRRAAAGPNQNFMGESRQSFSFTAPPKQPTSFRVTGTTFAQSPPEISGSRIRFDVDTLRRVLPSKSVWLQEEVAQPNFYRTEGFNAVFRPLGFHHSVVLAFQEGGQFLGYYPIWRSADQKSFSREDIGFLKEATPHIAHGIKVALHFARDESEAEPDFAPLGGWGSGVVLMDSDGKPIAMDSNARLIFQQLGAFEGPQVDTLSSRPVRDAFDYIRNTLRRIFHEPGGITARAPVCRIRLNWTGMAVRLRGIRMVGADGREYTTVLVERGETTESRRQRTILRWGLSAREAEILSLVSEGKTGPEMSILLGISHNTVRKHMSRIFEKLGVENRLAAASIALEAAAGTDLMAAAR